MKPHRLIGFAAYVLCSVAAPSGIARAQQIPIATPEGRAADIVVFRDEFLARDRSYSPQARTEAESRLRRLNEMVESVSQTYFEVELARIVALADNGHTRAYPVQRSRHVNRVNIRLAPFGQDFHVLRATARDSDLLGAKLIAIDGHHIGQLRRAARSMAGGLPQWRDAVANFVFESPDQLHALGLARSSLSAHYRFRTVSGAIVERLLIAAPPDPSGSSSMAKHWMIPLTMPDQNPDWRSALPAEHAPWSLQEPQEPFRLHSVPELNALVVQIRQNNNAPGHSISNFVTTAVTEIRTQRPRHLILDLRHNSGGDLNNTREFMEALPHLVTGRIFVLTSRWTFSAGLSSLGYLKQEGGQRVIIVGEPVGDRLMYYSEGDEVTLPNSQDVMRYADELHDYIHGCRDAANCHAASSAHPIALTSLAPDIAVPWTITAYMAGDDPAMEAIERFLRARRD